MSKLYICFLDATAYRLKVAGIVAALKFPLFPHLFCFCCFFMVVPCNYQPPPSVSGSTASYEVRDSRRDTGDIILWLPFSEFLPKKLPLFPNYSGKNPVEKRKKRKKEAKKDKEQRKAPSVRERVHVRACETFGSVSVLTRPFWKKYRRLYSVGGRVSCHGIHRW